MSSPRDGLHARAVERVPHGWKELHDQRVGKAMLYWEIVNGYVCFKMGPVPERARAEGAPIVRDELRALLFDAAKKADVDVVPSGRAGEYMSIARSTFDVRPLINGGALDEPRLREHLTNCRRVHEAVARKWPVRA